MNSQSRRSRSPQIPSSACSPTPGEEGAGRLTFEQALAALERVVQELEHGELGLSETLARYEQGVKYLKECYEQLTEAERRVELLKRIDASGQAETEPFDEAAMSLEEKAAARGARRSAQNPRRPRPESSRDDESVDGSIGLF
jgi:exodeoxyribonuclease VII small subunit